MKSILVIALVLGVAFGGSIFAQNKQVGIFTELQSIDNSDFGKKLLDTIALQLKNKSPLGDISKLLSEIKSELLSQQEKADAEESKAEQDCKSGVESYNARIDAATNEINEAIVGIANFRRQIEQLTARKEQYEHQIDTLNRQEAEFREVRKQDEESFASRISEQRAVVAALEQIIPELERLKPHGDVQAALIELARIGKTNPIGALLQVAMTLDPGALQRVVQHLNKLKESVTASIDQDIKDEENAKRNFDGQISKYDEQRTELENQLSETRQELETANQNLKAQESRLANNQQELEISTKGKQQLIEQCDERKARYNAETASRKKEIDVVDKVLSIIASRLETMQDYIQDRVNK